MNSGKKDLIIKYVKIAKRQYELVLFIEEGKPITDSPPLASNIKFTVPEYKNFLKILIRQSIYMISMYINEAMVLCFRNRDEFKRLLQDCDAPDIVTRIDEIWLIAKWIRNGFTHDPLHPQWKILNKKDLKKTFTLSSGLTLIPKSLNGNPIQLSDFGEANGLLCLCDDLIDNMGKLSETNIALKIGI